MTDFQKMVNMLKGMGIEGTRMDPEPGWPRHMPPEANEAIPADAFCFTVGQTAFWFSKDEGYIGYVTDDTWHWEPRGTSSMKMDPDGLMVRCNADEFKRLHEPRLLEAGYNLSSPKSRFGYGILSPSRDRLMVEYRVDVAMINPSVLVDLGLSPDKIPVAKSWREVD